MSRCQLLCFRLSCFVSVRDNYFISIVLSQFQVIVLLHRAARVVNYLNDLILNKCDKFVEHDEQVCHRVAQGHGPQVGHSW